MTFASRFKREIAGRDAHIPAARPPFGELVVRQGARRDGEDRLPFQRRIEQLEDVGLARTGRRLHDDVLPCAQRADRLLLPEIRDDQVDLEPLQHRRNCTASVSQGDSPAENNRDFQNRGVIFSANEEKGGAESGSGPASAPAADETGLPLVVLLQKLGNRCSPRPRSRGRTSHPDLRAR